MADGAAAGAEGDWGGVTAQRIHRRAVARTCWHFCDCQSRRSNLT